VTGKNNIWDKPGILAGFHAHIVHQGAFFYEAEMFVF
jgi:hypothetical protein